MKQLILFILFIFGTFTLYSQERIHFGYDSYGNRTERNYVISVEKTRSVKSNDGGNNPESGIGESKREVRVYPNPTKGFLQIETLGYTGKTGFRLYSSSGQLLQQSETGETVISLDLTEYPQGTSLLWVMFGKEREENKMLKE